SRLRAWLCLLLRPSIPRVSGLVGRPGFRNDDLRERECPAIIAEGACRSEMAAASFGCQRRHRSLPAGRAPISTYSAVCGRLATISQSARDHHEESFSDAGCRFVE